MSDLPAVRPGGCTMPAPARLLLTFTLVTGVLLLLWGYLSAYYLAALVWVANGALAVTGVPLSLNSPATSDAIVHPGVVGALALFAATGGRSLRWKMRWLTAVLIGLFATHATLLAADTWQVYCQSLAGQDRVEGLTRAAAEALHVAGDWVPLTGVVAAWFVATRSNATATAS